MGIWLTSFYQIAVNYLTMREVYLGFRSAAGSDFLLQMSGPSGTDIFYILHRRDKSPGGEVLLMSKKVDISAWDFLIYGRYFFLLTRRHNREGGYKVESIGYR